MDLSVVIINWNAADDTISCVHRIAAWQFLQPTVWVVDNASTDNSAEALVQACPDVNLIHNTVNRGFAGGTNQGIVKSLAKGNEPLLLLNNDALIDEQDVIKLLETLSRHERIGFVGPLIFSAEKKDQLISAGSKNPVLHHQTRVRHYDSRLGFQSVESLSGTAVVVRAAVFREAGLLDEAYFFSTEMADLCARAKKKGFLCVVNTEARAFHVLSRSSDFRNTLYTYYIIRNRFLYIRKFYHHLRKMGLNFFWGLYSITLIIKLVLSGHYPTANAVFLGLKDGISGQFGGQNERVLAVCNRSVVGAWKPGRVGRRS